MRLILTIFLFASLSARSQNYYVDNNGNDGSTGTLEAPFATLSKAFSVAGTGDTVYLKSGGVWHEKVVIPVDSLTIMSYGAGNKPVITGFQQVTGFTNNGNIWTATITAANELNTVLFNGKLVAKARYPNSSYLTSVSSTNFSIVGSLGGADYTGAKLVVRSAHWLLSIGAITRQSGDTLYHDDAEFGLHTGGGGFFIQDAKKLIDAAGEWYYDAATDSFSIYSATSPDISVSTIDTLIYLNNKTNISINGIEFTGANKGAIISDTSNNILIANCTFNNNGFNAIYGRKSKFVSITNDTITNSLNGAVMLTNDDFDNLGVDQCDSVTVTGNYIKNTAILEGMGGTGEGRYIAIWVTGNSANISYNVVDSTGYIPIYWNGYNTVIRKNIISNFCFVKDDGGGIYTIISYLPVATTGSRVVSNIIYNGLTALNGVSATLSTHGIYLDVGAIYVTVDSNTIYNCAASGILWHIPKYITSEKYNNIINCTGNQILYISLENLPLQSAVTNNVFANTINSNPLGYFTDGFSLSYFGTCDSNYYINQYYPNKIYKVSQTNFTLSSWQTSMSLDQHSKGIPEQADTTIDAELLVNPTDSDSLHLISDTYIDAKGNIYNNSIPIPSHYSVIVFKAIRHIYTDRKLYGLKFKKVKEQ